jgi:hypothetical protein
MTPIVVIVLVLFAVALLAFLFALRPKKIKSPPKREKQLANGLQRTNRGSRSRKAEQKKKCNDASWIREKGHNSPKQRTDAETAKILNSHKQKLLEQQQAFQDVLEKAKKKNNPAHMWETLKDSEKALQCEFNRFNLAYEKILQTEVGPLAVATDVVCLSSRFRTLQTDVENLKSAPKAEKEQILDRLQASRAKLEQIQSDLAPVCESFLETVNQTRR